ncbi:hypothetical protein [Mastigocoleus testarum]|uniref:Uncharacterized protein n=1 Tax=Mastigocoleus testarum BC008 TaxID=371196 RepID=A0A0V7ZR29_9CYAN|nr:hypothetical protein [Mastigocoleus testarum]KST66807.1 hypothetical protein BC008_26845 [Mastigocoleus testarum BC008]
MGSNSHKYRFGKLKREKLKPEEFKFEDLELTSTEIENIEPKNVEPKNVEPKNVKPKNVKPKNFEPKNFELNRQEILSRRTPKPGEIWEVRSSTKSPVEFSRHQQDILYSEIAQNFLAGKSPPRYVLIITDIEYNGKLEEQLQIVSIMLLSEEIQYLSDVDLLIPSEISGLGRDMLAQTWLLEEMLSCNLLKPVGKRLSRKIYDLLLDVSDREQGVEKPPPKSDLEETQLKIGTRKTSESKEIQAFHQRELGFCDVLSIPVAAYRSYLKSIRFTETLLNEVFEIEQELLEIDD